MEYNQDQSSLMYSRKLIIEYWHTKVMIVTIWDGFICTILTFVNIQWKTWTFQNPYIMFVRKACYKRSDKYRMRFSTYTCLDAL
jgi:hypothetical protein